MNSTIKISNVSIKCKPFLRWTGSKKWFINTELDKFLPKTFNNYHECFLGSGAVFFALQPNKKSFLYDVNSELIETFIQIRDNLDDVISSLKKLKNTEKDYYDIRSRNCKTPHTRAAKFIYLNRCSFNGIYRVNNKGIYNVPYGKRLNVDILTESNLKAVNLSLQNTIIEVSDFKFSLTHIKKGDLVFLDPPYTIAHENNGFIEYNQKLFSWDDQIALRIFCEKLHEMGAYFILTNAYHKSLLDLYDGLGKIKKVSRYSKVGGRNKTRGVYNELVVFNTSFNE
jgi:DNA adenine methylase